MDPFTLLIIVGSAAAVGWFALSGDDKETPAKAPPPGALPAPPAPTRAPSLPAGKVAASPAALAASRARLAQAAKTAAGRQQITDSPQASASPADTLRSQAMAQVARTKELIALRAAHPDWPVDVRGVPYEPTSEPVRSGRQMSGMGDAGKGAAKGIATTAAVVGTATAAASTAAGSAALTAIGVSAAVVSSVPLVGWIAGAALAVAGAFVALGRAFSGAYSPAEAKAYLQLVTGHPALFGLMGPHLWGIDSGLRAEVWAKNTKNCEGIAGIKVPPHFSDPKWIARAVHLGQFMASLPGPVGAKYLLTTAPKPAHGDIAGYAAWYAHTVKVAGMTSAEYKKSHNRHAFIAMQHLVAQASKLRNWKPYVDVADWTMLAEKRGALWALAHARGASESLKAAAAFQAYVASWYGPSILEGRGRALRPAPIDRGCKPCFAERSRKAMDMLRRHPLALGWIDPGWAYSLGVSRCLSFGVISDSCDRENQITDMIHALINCAGKPYPAFDGDKIADYLARAHGPRVGCTKAGVPYLDVATEQFAAHRPRPLTLPAGPVAHTRKD